MHGLFGLLILSQLSWAMSYYSMIFESMGASRGVVQKTIVLHC
jgi:hypothetical protein